MEMLRDRLAELADDAPRGGAPAAELWARGRRSHRLRTAAVAAAVLVVGVGGAGIGVQLADGGETRPDLAPVTTVGFALPIEYPAAEELPELGAAPGPLAAVWLVTRPGGGVPSAVGLVAETGTFGTLPLDLPPEIPGEPHDMVVALSPDGRRIAYPSPSLEVVVRDLVSGQTHSPAIESRVGFSWADADRLVGHVAGGSDADGWVWKQGAEPELVDYWAFAEGFDLWATQGGSDPGSPGGRRCASPIILDATGHYGEFREGWGYAFDVPVLCDVLGIIGTETLLGHWNSDRSPGGWGGPDDGNRTVVALDIPGADPQFEDPTLRRVVVTADAPARIAIATDLIAAVLDADGGAS